LDIFNFNYFFIIILIIIILLIIKNSNNVKENTRNDKNFKIEINQVCSLGTLCQPALMLKRNNLKLQSYPFDWIFSNPDIIMDCLNDDFTSFLDKSNYIDIGEDKCGHTKYHPRMFNHHNPLHEKNYQYYIRCVNRFRKLLENKEDRKLFIIFFPNVKQIDESHISKIKQLNEKLSEYTSNYILLAINNLSEMENRYYEFTQYENIDFLELHTLSKSFGISFKNFWDDNYFDKIIKRNYNFNLK